MTEALTVLYLACFQAAAWPSVVRILRRRSSADLSVWREVIILVGVTAQFQVMMSSGVPWHVWVSPIFSAANVGLLLGVIWRYR